MRDDSERLRDIMEAIERIEVYAARGREVFEHDELIQTWVVHHLQIIGEAARGLSDEFRASHEVIPWREIITMRNILVHDYFHVNTTEVWNTVERDLPGLKSSMASIARL